MTPADFWMIVTASGIAPHLVTDPADIRFHIGKAIGILNWHIPPDLSYQENRPLMKASLREQFQAFGINWIIDRKPQPEEFVTLTVIIWKRRPAA